MAEEMKLDLDTSRRKRLQDTPDWRPWIPAENSSLPDCRLLWMPVSGFPLRHKEQAWIDEFLVRLGDGLSAHLDLRSEFFLEYKQITPELADDFRRYAQKCVKLLGLGRSRNSPPPHFPAPGDIKAAVSSGEPFDFKDWLSDYVIWFASKHPEEQRRLFLASGGVTILYLPPDRKLKPFKSPFTPALRASLPVFQRVDVDGLISGTLAMQDAFLEKSKGLLGEDLRDLPEYPGLAFILPLLDSEDFFHSPPELRAKWFDLFTVYIRESRRDRGMLLAYSNDAVEPVLQDVLESMQRDGLIFEGQP